MSQELWTDVDHYLTDSLHEPDASLDAALEASAAAGLPPIQVSTNQGKLLHLLARIQGARRILEVGTLGGYSTIWLARALPAGGKLISLELEPLHAEVARENLQRAGLGGVAEVRLGRAIDSLAALSGETPEPFDFVFIDADKPSNADYFEWALRLTKPGSVIVVDNVVRGGAVADSNSTNEAVLGVRRLHDLIHGDPRVTATGIQTVGTKGYDGFTLALVV
ncbi:MAG: O-methyltransferase [Acidimicrobiales bacterium]|jgi:predicted O-methyltransferase YrrM